MRLIGIANHPALVERITDLTASYRRIRFRSEDCVAGLEMFPTLWVRLWVPAPDRGPAAVVQRAYTIVEIDRAAGTFDLDFVLHESAGPAGDWARSTAPGDRLEIALTPARVELPPQLGAVLLAGDRTALSAVNSWLDALPPTVPVRVLLEDGHDDRAHLPRSGRERANHTWQWVEPQGPPGAALAAAVARISPEPGLFGWAAGERGLIKALRPVLAQHLALDRAHRFTQFYWIAGKPFG